MHKMLAQWIATAETSCLLGAALFKEGCDLSFSARSRILSYLTPRRLSCLLFVKLSF